MKTKEQVIRYLSRRSYDDADWQAILQKCHFLYGSGIRKALRPKLHSTYQEFNEWLDMGIGDGTIVSYNDYIGIFCDNGDGTYRLLAYYGPDEKIIVGDIPVKIGEVLVINGDKFYSDLRKQGLQYSVTLANVYERKMPKPFSKVLYRHNDINGVGFVRKCIDGKVYFICGFDVKFRKEYFISLNEIDFFDINRAGIQTLQREMNKNKVSFDKKAMALVDIISRAEENETYWYLTDILSICRATEKKTSRDEARYNSYNYFLNYNEALDMREWFISTRKKMIKGLE